MNPQVAREVAARPRLAVLDHFLGDDDLGRIDRLTANPPELEARGIAVHRDATGLSCELPLELDEVLESVARRIEQTLGIANDFGPSLRYRRYAVGDGHPPHLDTYEIDGLHLVATAVLYLCDTEAGGETSFPRAVPEPVTIAPRRGRLAYWFNYLPDGTPDPASWHEGLPVLAGEKRTLAAFIYRPLEVSPSIARFVCVDDGVPEETTDLLRQACAERGLTYVSVDARTFDFDPARRLAMGDILYRPSVSYAASLVEQFLHAPGVATFYAGPDRIFFAATGWFDLYDRAGLPLPRTVPCATSDRALLRAFADRLGGFPLIAKFAGGEGGVGVVRVDSLPAYFSLADYALSQGRVPYLAAYVDGAAHWRVVVVGARAVAAYRNPIQSDDFRSYASEDPSDVTADPDADLADLAIRAVAALKLEFGGVDILRDPAGRLYLLEVNFPCYFAHAQRVAGIDVAGAMLDFLAAKALARTV